MGRSGTSTAGDTLAKCHFAPHNSINDHRLRLARAVCGEAIEIDARGKVPASEVDGMGTWKENDMEPIQSLGNAGVNVLRFTEHGK